MHLNVRAVVCHGDVVTSAVEVLQMADAGRFE